MSYQLELRHYRYFMAVAEALHYRKAAERLFISQPGLSRQIKQMEEILETQLFIRDKKKVQLTPAGDYLKKELEAALSHLEQTTKQVKLIGKGQLGEIRIGFLGSAMQEVIPSMLLQLKETYPEIHTSLEELSNKAQVSAILKNQLDIGFVRLSRIPSGLRIKPVFEDTFSLVLPKNHALNPSNFKGIEQLSEADFILFSQDYSPLYYDTVISICEDAGFKPQISHKSVHAQTIFKLVENGLGISIVPTALQHGFQLNVKFIELAKIKQRAVLSVLWKDDHHNLALKHCLDLLFDS
ncbi:LysR family transcriptional regulator [Croceitalea sp. P059]|uniref:LysR family transcriptional regulator n=1 Tax=Croceitalea sp. P059 TaxID=3075601 RepID=UPI00288459CD|nr:LysR family transcriptional regulator [Croceitalea sp. P059]MDT0539100.1 LysR family transcriptional regulator [Croceitalea sp. P059]